MKIWMFQKSKSFFKPLLYSVTSVLILYTSTAPVQAAASSATAVADDSQSKVSASTLPGPLYNRLPPLSMGPGFEEINRDALMGILGMSSDEIQAALESGQSLVQIAASRSVNEQKIADLVAQALTVRLSREFKDGVITQSQYEGRLGEVSEHADAAIRRMPPTPPQPGAEIELGLPLGPGLEHINKDALLQLLGISSDKLSAALSGGKSLAAIAAAQGVDVQKITDLLAQTMLNRLDQELNEKSIWKDEYEIRKQEIASRVSDIIQHTPPVPPTPPAPSQEQTSK